jgi:hypothetical protein
MSQKSPESKEFKTAMSAGKVMLIIFWDVKGSGEFGIHA